MTTHAESRGIRALTVCGIALAAALGTAGRLYLLADQVILDDEWHSVAFARAHSLYEVLTRVHSSANSPPPQPFLLADMAPLG